MKPRAHTPSFCAYKLWSLASLSRNYICRCGANPCVSSLAPRATLALQHLQDPKVQIPASERHAAHLFKRAAHRHPNSRPANNFHCCGWLAVLSARGALSQGRFLSARAQKHFPFHTLAEGRGRKSRVGALFACSR